MSKKWYWLIKPESLTVFEVCCWDCHSSWNVSVFYDAFQVFECPQVFNFIGNRIESKYMDVSILQLRVYGQEDRVMGFEGFQECQCLRVISYWNICGEKLLDISNAFREVQTITKNTSKSHIYPFKQAAFIDYQKEKPAGLLYKVYF